MEAASAFSSVTYASANLPDLSCDIPVVADKIVEDEIVEEEIVEDENVEQDTPWDLRHLTSKNDPGCSTLQRLQELLSNL